MENRILVVGNDEKMWSCCNRLMLHGFDAFCIDRPLKECLDICRLIVLQIPTFRYEFVCGTDIYADEFCCMLTDKHTVFSGNVSADFFPCKAFCYGENKNFKENNSRLTAQGTLKIILESVKTDLTSLKAAVLGYGACGKEICRVLKNNGVSVTSYSRRDISQREAEKNGIPAVKLDEINETADRFDIIVNTVPFNIVDETGLSRMTEKTLYIEIASKPFGFNPVLADSYCFGYVQAGGLPGRFTPVGAGINIADTVDKIIKEVNYE